MKRTGIGIRATGLMVALQAAAMAAALAQDSGLRVVSERTLAGFAFPESVGCDPAGEALYVSQFGSALKPAEKDGQGRISRLSLDGEVLDEHFLPTAGKVLHKPKGIWIQDGRLWVTDIDVVWVFDLATRRGRQVALPGIEFANDPAVRGGVLYVTDNRADQLYTVEPADFLDAPGEPVVKRVFAGRAINPNGVYPASDGRMRLVGFKSPDEPRGIFALSAGGGTEALSEPIGRLDGVWEMPDGALLVTDWGSGSLFRWRPGGHTQTLATGFKGPADFCVMARGDSDLVAVPDLVKSELRLIELGR